MSRSAFGIEHGDIEKGFAYNAGRMAGKVAKPFVAGGQKAKSAGAKVGGAFKPRGSGGVPTQAYSRGAAAGASVANHPYRTAGIAGGAAVGGAGAVGAAQHQRNKNRY